ncbi:HIT family protein [Shouchella clausii]|uniref:HIT family protein n=1 Tax=Shouchella clausii TaxID=79880 RepID=A0A268S379_SHOCL|nr:HIT family protein [Shouchella clausii]PAD93525.1 HIT family protein [Shouchella clausii]PAF26974.1 HIT family protein [Shouchella clausii]
MDSAECLGCNLANNMEFVYKVYENEFVSCILDHDPFNKGHVLILPKEHFEELDQLNRKTANIIIETSQIISKAIKELYKPDGITICQNGGIFSELTHFHMHVVPRYINQSFAPFYSEEPFQNGKLKKELSDTHKELEYKINQLIM